MSPLRFFKLDLVCARNRKRRGVGKTKMAEQNERWEIKVDDEIRLIQLGGENAGALFSLVNRNREYLLQWFHEHYVYRDQETVWEDISPDGVMRTHSPSTFQLGIWYRGEIVGVISFYPGAQGATYFIGYWIGEIYQGKGIVTRSVKALIDDLFALAWVMKIEIHCAVLNTKSQAIPRKLGFYEGATIHDAERLQGKIVDHIVFTMPRMKWLGDKHPLVAKWRAKKREAQKQAGKTT